MNNSRIHRVKILYINANLELKDYLLKNEEWGNEIEQGLEGGIPAQASAAKPSVFLLGLIIVYQALQLGLQDFLRSGILPFSRPLKKEAVCNRIKILHQK